MNKSLFKTESVTQPEVGENKRKGPFYSSVYCSLSPCRYKPNGVYSRTPDDKVSYSLAKRMEQKNKPYIVATTNLLHVYKQYHIRNGYMWFSLNQ